MPIARLREEKRAALTHPQLSPTFGKGCHRARPQPPTSPSSRRGAFERPIKDDKAEAATPPPPPPPPPLPRPTPPLPGRGQEESGTTVPNGHNPTHRYFAEGSWGEERPSAAPLRCPKPRSAVARGRRLRAFKQRALCAVAPPPQRTTNPSVLRAGKWQRCGKLLCPVQKGGSRCRAILIGRH